MAASAAPQVAHLPSMELIRKLYPASGDRNIETTGVIRDTLQTFGVRCSTKENQHSERVASGLPPAASEPALFLAGPDTDIEGALRAGGRCRSAADHVCAARAAGGPHRPTGEVEGTNAGAACQYRAVAWQYQISDTRRLSCCRYAVLSGGLCAMYNIFL